MRKTNKENRRTKKENRRRIKKENRRRTKKEQYKADIQNNNKRKRREMGTKIY